MTDGLTARSATVTVVAQTVARAVSLVAIVVSTALVARTLGVDRYADWVTVLSLVALFAFLLDPGIAGVVVRRLTQEPGSAPTPAAMWPLRIVLGLGAFVLVVGISVALRGSDSLVLAIALGGQVLPRALVLNATPWLQTDHRLHRQTALEAVAAGTGLALLGIAVALDAPAAVLALVGFTGPTAALAVLMRRELRLTPSASLPSPGPQRPKVRSVLLEVAPLSAALSLTAIYTRLYTVFVNAAEETAEVARYLFAFQFVEQILVVAGIVAGALLPILSRRAAGLDLFRDALTHRMLVAAVGIGAIGSASLLGLAAPLCRIIGGPELAASDRYLLLLAPMSSLFLPAFLLGYLYLALGLARRYLWFNVAALIVNLAGNAIFTLSEGAVATARVSWVTELLVVTLAMAPLAASGRTGREAAARCLALFALVVVAAELTASDAVAPVPAALVVLAATGVVAGGPLLGFARSVVRG